MFPKDHCIQAGLHGMHFAGNATYRNNLMVVPEPYTKCIVYEGNPLNTLSLNLFA
jgi:hypothetical protein